MAEDPQIFDVLIIGAGTCGLAMASRLCEPAPSALFTDEEHQRYHWIKKHGHRMSIKQRRTGTVVPCVGDTCKGSCPSTASPNRLRYSTLVLDATADRWMARWDELFGRFGISHLRSPMFWHVDPSDRDALLAHVHELGRQDELFELKGCVGKEISKHHRKARTSCRNRKRACGGHSDVEIDERERRDYFNPPTDLFSDHCQSVAGRYGLQSPGLVRNERVQDVQFKFFQHVSRDEKLFAVHTDRKGAATDTQQYFARTVILAVGPANEPHIPDGIPGISDHRASSPSPPSPPPPRVAHVTQMETSFPDPCITSLIAQGKPTNILIIGGGLTSAQLTDLAIRSGVAKVWHLVRHRLLVKYFDVDLCWMAKYRNVEQANFWGAGSDDERLELMAQARGGGSISPRYYRRLKKHVAAGRLVLKCETRLVGAEFDEFSQTWGVTTDPPLAEGEESEEIPPRFDFIYFATGIQADVRTLPYMQSMLREHPIETRGGLPCLTEDLGWKDDVPFFVTGRLAGLRLGPAAPNLGGARAGAERISWAVDEFLEEKGRGRGQGEDDEEVEIYDDAEKGEEDIFGFATGRNNMFRKLRIEEDGDW